MVWLVRRAAAPNPVALKISNGVRLAMNPRQSKGDADPKANAERPHPPACSTCKPLRGRRGPCLPYARRTLRTLIEFNTRRVL